MPALIQQQRRMTAEELADPGVQEKFIELIEGEFVTTTPSGKYHNRICSEFEILFRDFCMSRPELDYGGDNDGFLVERHPDTVLSPDASLFKRREETPSTWMEFAPELVVEVLSPGNSATEMAFKRHRFFKAGTEQFWLVDIGERKIDFYFRDGRVLSVTGEETIPGEGIAEGLDIDLTEIFRER